MNNYNLHSFRASVGRCVNKGLTNQKKKFDNGWITTTVIWSGN